MQTAAVRVLTTQLSDALQAEVRIGQIDYRFFNTLHLDDVLLRDRQQDTLAYIDELDLQLRLSSLINNQLQVRRLRIYRPRINIHDGNADFLLRAFKPDQPTRNDSLRITMELENLSVEHLNATINDWHLSDATTAFAIHELSNERVHAQIYSLNGVLIHDKKLIVENLSGQVLIEDSLLDMPALNIQLPSTRLEMKNIHMSKDSVSLLMHNSYITPRDLELLLNGDMAHLDNQFGFDVDLRGSQDSLHLHQLVIRYNKQTMLKGNAVVYAVTEDLDSIRVCAQLEDMYLTGALIQDFIADITDAPYQLTPIVHRLGEMHYKGSVEGRLNDMVLHGAFRTARGVVTTNGQLKSDKQFQDFIFNGDIGIRRFQLGRMLGNRNIGAVTLMLHANGEWLRNQSFKGHVDANLQQAQLFGYNYRDINLNANMGDREINGAIHSADPNLHFDIQGMSDWSDTEPALNFTLDLRHLRLDSLHLTDRLNGFDLTMMTYLNFSGTSIEHLNGYLVIDTMTLQNAGKSVRMEQLKITAESDNHDSTLHTIKLQSDFAVGRFAGHFHYGQLTTSVMKMGIRYLPHIFTEKTRQTVQSRPSHTQADFYLFTHDVNKILDVLPTTIRQTGDVTVKGMIDEPAKQLALSAVVPNLTMNGYNISDMALAADNIHDRLNLKARATLDLPDTAGYGDAQMIMHTMAYHDTLIFTLTGGNTAGKYYGGDIALMAHFDEHKHKPQINVDILPSSFMLADTTWLIRQAHVQYTAADTAIDIANFGIETNGKYLQANGRAGTSVRDSLVVNLQDMDLETLLGFTMLDKHAFYANGKLSGNATLYSLLSGPALNADLYLANAGLNGYHIGDAHAWAKLNAEDMSVDIGGEVIEDGAKRAIVKGLVTPRDQGAWELDIWPDSIQIDFINHWTHAFLKDIDGRASGHVKVFSRNRLVWVTIEVQPHDAALTVPFTGGRYIVNDSIFMDSTSIRFPHLHLKDTEGNAVTFNGQVNHENFFRWNYWFDIGADKAIVLNQSGENHPPFYGKVYGTGDLHCEGNEQHGIKMLAHANAIHPSVFNLNLGGTANAAEVTFIEFVDEDSVPAKHTIDTITIAEYLARRQKPLRDPHASDLDFDLFVTVDQGTQFNVVLGGNDDNTIKGRGEGDMRVHLLNNELQLQGKLTLRQGNVTYALGNVVHRDFQIADGSSISWNGDPSSMTLDVTAKYHLTASLRDLFGSNIDALQTNRTSVPVNCIIYIKGPLSDPILSFGLEFPQSDQTIQQQVKSLITSDEMLMREVMYLLVFNRFFTPDYLNATNSTILNDAYSLIGSTVTGQINSWLSKLTNIVTFGINLRGDGEGTEATTEYEAQFSITPVDGLIINGNVGYRYNDLNNRPVFGELDIEYVITPDGKLRVKGYTHSVDKYSLRQANMVNGVGFVIKHDF